MAWRTRLRLDPLDDRLCPAAGVGDTAYLATHLADQLVALQQPAPAAVPALFLDFKSVTTGKNYALTIKVRLADGTAFAVPVSVGAAATPQQVRDLVRTALSDVGLRAEANGNTGLIVKGTAKSELAVLWVVLGDVDGKSPDGQVSGPSLVGTVGSVSFSYLDGRGGPRVNLFPD